MNTNDVCPSHPISSKPLPVRLDPFPVDKRAVYVHSICSVLLDSRFGPRRREPFVVHLSDHPESVVDLDALCDLTNKSPFSSYMASTIRRCMADAILEDALRSKSKCCELAAVSIRGQSLSPSPLGRGSPRSVRSWQSAVSSYQQFLDIDL